MQIIEANDERWLASEVLRLRGNLLRAEGDLVAAEDSYNKAVAVALKQGAMLFEFRATTDLARLWRDQGKRDKARELLSSMYGWFIEGFDTLDLKETKALLDELVP
jgi:predicted ATPase